MKLEFDAISCNESFARSAVCAFAAQLDPTMSELTELRTVVSEAVTNSIVHGYAGKTGKVLLDVAIYADRRVRIKVKDKGCGIADIEQARKPLYSTDPSGERGGMGFSIMESFTDSIKIVSVPGRCTSVSMMKRLRG